MSGLLPRTRDMAVEKSVAPTGVGSKPRYSRPAGDRAFCRLAMIGWSSGPRSQPTAWMRLTCGIFCWMYCTTPAKVSSGVIARVPQKYGLP